MGTIIEFMDLEQFAADLTNIVNRRPPKKYCNRGHLLSPDNKIKTSRKDFVCRECRRWHQWLVKRGLRLTDYTPEELRQIVPPRKLKSYLGAVRVGRPARQIVPTIQHSAVQLSGVEQSGAQPSEAKRARR